MPTLKAALALADLWFDHFGNIDIYKTSISVSGATVQYLWRTLNKRMPTVRFGLFEQEQGPLHKELIDNVVGGLSIVIRRLVTPDTPIHADLSIKSKRIIGYDANS